MFARTFKDPQKLMSLGMFCLALGSITNWLFHRTNGALVAPFWSGLGDGVMGALYGAAIALTLLAARANARRKRWDSTGDDR